MAGECEAIIVAVLPPDMWAMANDWEDYKIEYVRKDLGVAIISGAKLKKITESDPVVAVLKCECGVDSIGAGKHSSWCPKVFKN